MDSQTEALDLSRGPVVRGHLPQTPSAHDASGNAEIHVDVDGDVDVEGDVEPASKRRRVSESGEHSAVIQWLARNSFDRSSSDLDSSTVSVGGSSLSQAPPAYPLTPPPHVPVSTGPSTPTSVPHMPRAGLPVPAVASTVQGVTVTLQDGHLWKAFNNTGTEMIINKSGRRMFPYVTISVEGLDPHELYSLHLEVIQADDSCYKYVNKQWSPVGAGESVPTNPPVSHNDSPKPGAFWMKANISFASVKITNTKDRAPNKIFLRSMHKYMTRVHIVRGNPGLHDVSRCPTYIFTLPETSFIAVTAYKNKAVTYMKIMNNPFAKPYRESATEAPPRARCLRKLFKAGQLEDRKEYLEVKAPVSPIPIAPSAVTNPPPVTTPSPAPPTFNPAMWYAPPAVTYPPAPTAPYYFQPPPLITPYNPYLQAFDPTHRLGFPMGLSLCK